MPTDMSLKRNITANYISQLYVAGIGILTVPLYIKYMGPEAYGLVGFFAVLQVFFNLLDAGLTPTMARESARYHGGALSILEYRRLARAMESFFVAVALLGGAVLVILVSPISTQWLNASQLSQQEILLSLQIMSFIVALRWICGFYKGIITGAERLVWLSGFNSIIATGRFVLVLPVLIFISASPRVFFLFQLGVAIIEIVGVTCMAYRLLPAIPKGQRISWEWAPLQSVLKFSLTIAFTSSVWVFVTQTDKLILSTILPLAEYGYFTLAVLVASSIITISSPISTAIMPRMARLHAEGQQDELMSVYRKSTQLVTTVVIPVALILIFLAPQVLLAWTGKKELAQLVAPVLSLYAIGYAFLSLSAFPYYLQYAKGKLQMHLIGSTLFLSLLIPTTIWAATRYGMEGTAWAWLLSNLIYFLLWVPVVHHKFLKGMHRSWMVHDIGLLSIAPIIAGFLLINYMQWSVSRLHLIFQILISASIFVILSLISASRVRSYILGGTWLTTKI
jgi:O-antigen/teichoic acid export membrane protein